MDARCRRLGSLFGLVSLGAAASLGGCAVLAPAKRAAIVCDKELQCYLDQAVDVIASLNGDINWWSTLQGCLIFASIALSAVSTVVIGLQDDSNKHKTRPVGLIATTVGTAMTTIISTFHVPDNIDKLIETRAQLATAVNELEYDFKHRPEEQRDELLHRYALKVSDLMTGVSKLKGSAGRLNIEGSQKP